MGMYMSADLLDKNRVFRSVSNEFFPKNRLMGVYDESKAYFKVTSDIFSYFESLGYKFSEVTLIKPSDLLSLYSKMWCSNPAPYITGAIFYDLQQFIAICMTKQFTVSIS